MEGSFAWTLVLNEWFARMWNQQQVDQGKVKWFAGERITCGFCCCNMQ